jgi:hypothetical protein
MADGQFVEAVFIRKTFLTLFIKKELYRIG